MNIPPAEIIESAVDEVVKLAAGVLADQQSELGEAIGAADASRMNIAFPLSSDFRSGYALGLQTARIMVRGTDPNL